MTHHVLDDQDLRALRSLDANFAISADGEIAAVKGMMEIKIVRPADNDGNQLLFTIVFSGGEQFSVRLSRKQTLAQLGVEGGNGN